ncbi:unnamed protein product, partial [Phaeothamnion confervicola]
PASKTLGCGIVEARSVWRADPARMLPLLQAPTGVAKTMRSPRLRIQPSCSLQFMPVDAAAEVTLKVERPAVAGVLSFAVQKLGELGVLARASLAPDAAAAAPVMAEDAAAWDAFRASVRGSSDACCEAELARRLDALGKDPFTRSLPFEERTKLQLPGLPLLPTTTVGSFPQTAEVRRLRGQFKKGSLSESEYLQQMDLRIAHAIGVQEGLGLDVLVHGEASRVA